MRFYYALHVKTGHIHWPRMPDFTGGRDSLCFSSLEDNMQSINKGHVGWHLDNHRVTPEGRLLSNSPLSQSNPDGFWDMGRKAAASACRAERTTRQLDCGPSPRSPEGLTCRVGWAWRDSGSLVRPVSEMGGVAHLNRHTLCLSGFCHTHAVTPAPTSSNY